jgi:hypothetical protein
MENENGKIHILKQEKAIVNRPTQKLLKAAQSYNSEYDERYVEQVGKSIGFTSTDDKV